MLRVAVLPLVAPDRDQLLRTAEWFRAVSLDRCSIEFEILPKANPPKPIAWYKQAGGKGAWPNNSQALATDLLSTLEFSRRSAPLLIFSGDEFLPHTWHVQSRRYSVIPATATIGIVAHEIGHLLFDWPDLHWPPQYAAECLMARGAVGNRSAAPAWPCGPLLVDAGWREVIPVTRELTPSDLRSDCVGSIDWNGQLVLAEARQNHLLAYIGGRYPRMFARIALTPEDRRRSLLGLLAADLRRLPRPT